MPPKQKSKREDWKECFKCQRVVHSRDTILHKEQCQEGLPLTHGFLQNGILHAVVSHSVQGIKQMQIFVYNRHFQICKHIMRVTRSSLYKFSIFTF